MLLLSILKQVNKALFSLVKSMVQAHLEIGLPRVPSSKVLRQLLLSLSREFTDPTLSVWVFFPCNSTLVRTLRLLASLARSSSPSTHLLMEKFKLDKRLRSLHQLVASSHARSDLTHSQKSPTIRMVAFFHMCSESSFNEAKTINLYLP